MGDTKEPIKLDRKLFVDGDTGCDLASLVLGGESKCGKKCPFQKCLYDHVDEAVTNLLQDIMNAISTNTAETSRKGRWCPYKTVLFCQEGYCRECGIYLMKNVAKK